MTKVIRPKTSATGKNKSYKIYKENSRKTKISTQNTLNDKILNHKTREHIKSNQSI